MNKSKLFPSLDGATTPADMRAAIERHARNCPVVHHALLVADINQMTPEDRYSMLAYHALQALAETQRALVEMAARMPPVAMVVHLQGVKG